MSLSQTFPQEDYTGPLGTMKPQVEFGQGPSLVRLRPHQMVPTRALLRGQRGLLVAHGLGSGKTLTGLAAAINLLRLGTVSEAIVIVPLKLLETQWRPAIDKYAFDYKTKIRLTTYEQVDLILEADDANVIYIEGGLVGGARSVASEESNVSPTVRNAFYSRTFVEGDIIDVDALQMFNETSGKQEFENAKSLVTSLGIRNLLGGARTKPTNVHLEESIVIFDEAHRLRTFGTQDQSFAIQVSLKAKRLLTMTATPLVNNPSDASIHFNMFEKRFPSCDAGNTNPNPGWLPMDSKTFSSVYLAADATGVETIVPSMKAHQAAKVANWVSTQNLSNPNKGPDQPREDFVLQAETSVPMTDAQHEIYFKAETKLAADLTGQPRANAFYSQTRQQCNTVQDQLPALPSAQVEPKLVAIVQAIDRQLQIRANRLAGLSNEKEEMPIIVQSEFIERGVNRVENLLKQKYASRGLDVGRILKVTGQVRQESILKSIGARLQDPLSYDVLFISGAGTEGLDTKGVRQIHVVEPPWNQSALDQTLGRAVRYKSHSLLPINERNVKIFLWQAIKTENQKAQEIASGRPHLDVSTDQYISSLVRKKHQVNLQFQGLMECNSLDTLLHKPVQCANSITILRPAVANQQKTYRKIFRGSTNELLQESFIGMNEGQRDAWTSTESCRVMRSMQSKQWVQLAPVPFVLPSPEDDILVEDTPVEDIPVESPEVEIVPNVIPSLPSPINLVTPSPVRVKSPAKRPRKPCKETQRRNPCTTRCARPKTVLKCIQDSVGHPVSPSVLDLLKN